MKYDIKSMLPCEIEEKFISIGERKYRALQVFAWLHKGARNFEEMTDLPKPLRDKLNDIFCITSPDIVKKQISEKDKTVKYLWGMEDDCVESVLLHYKHGKTVCISAQVGCRMGCIFCASAIDGLKRNLTASEMLDQVIFSGIDSGESITNVVLMGIGEPLDNFDNVMRFIELVRHPKGLNIGARHITVSTCGITENIDRLADCGVQLSLAVSLHAPDDETRSMLIPYNKRTGVKALMEAAGRYTAKTGRRVSYEYAMIDGINDSPGQAHMLSKLLQGSGSHLNLILLSSVPGRNYKASAAGKLKAFTGVLLENNIKFTTRRSLGADIEASCGQLRRKSLT